jgi:hypothetical protein
LFSNLDDIYTSLLQNTKALFPTEVIVAIASHTMPTPVQHLEEACMEKANKSDQVAYTGQDDMRLAKIYHSWMSSSDGRE